MGERIAACKRCAVTNLAAGAGFVVNCRRRASCIRLKSLGLNGALVIGVRDRVAARERCVGAYLAAFAGLVDGNTIISTPVVFLLNFSYNFPAVFPLAKIR